MTRYNTLLLDTSLWDLTLDDVGDIALVAPGYALAQDVASACRLFRGELYYDNAQGIRYFEDILGKAPSSLITEYMQDAALTVPGVQTAQCIITSTDGRTVTGELQFIDEEGEANGIIFN